MSGSACKIIQIDWIRHGLSCANVMHHYGGLLGPIKQGVLQDPQLTLGGYDEAVSAGTCLGDARKDYDVVCASVLQRAIETAIGIFQGSGKPIYVIPYVSEKRRVLGIDKQNAPADSLEQLKKSVAEFQEKVGTNVHINYSGVDDPKVWEDGKAGPNIGHFRKHVLNHIVNLIDNQRKAMIHGLFDSDSKDSDSDSKDSELFNDIPEPMTMKPFRLHSDKTGTTVEIPGNRVYRIAIVSHGRFIREDATNLEVYLEQMKKRGKLADFYHSRVCQSVPALTHCCDEEADPAIAAFAEKGSYSNPNTSIWRQYLRVNCDSNLKIIGHRLEKIYTPVGSLEKSGLKAEHISNCSDDVKHLLDP